MPLSDLADLTKRRLTLEMLRTHGHCRLQVSGSSMLPALWPGDTVRIESRSLARFEPGDIVLYERADRLFLHRLVDFTTEGSEVTLITAGDSVPEADLPVRADHVKGVLTGVRRGDDWVAVPKRLPTLSACAAYLLSRSSILGRWAVRLRARTRSVGALTTVPEVPPN